MNPQQVKQMLAETLADHRLSRSERQAMSRILEHLDPSPQALAVYRAAAFDLAREALAEADMPAVLQWLEDVMKLLQSSSTTNHAPPDAEACFSPGDDCPKRIARLFITARKTADVCVFTITDDRIADAILDAHRRGVRVRIVTDDDKSADLGSDIGRLASAGIPVRIDRSQYHMHHKFALFDGRQLLTGSYNWTRGAAEWNEENFVITADPRLISPFAGLFEQLWEKFGG